MNSPAEVQVADGDLEAYLWPSEAIRQKAIDQLMTKIDDIADKELRSLVTQLIGQVKANCTAEADKLYLIRSEAAAAITRLQSVIEKAEQTVVGVAPPQPPQPDLLNISDFSALKENVREIGKLLYQFQLILQEAENKLSQSGIYISDTSLQGKLLSTLVSEDFSKKIVSFKHKIESITSRLGIVSQY